MISTTTSLLVGIVLYIIIIIIIIMGLKFVRTPRDLLKLVKFDWLIRAIIYLFYNAYNLILFYYIFIMK
jgi:hypothetical protein